MAIKQFKSPFCSIGWCAWVEIVGGWQCSVCGDFIPWGSETWIERDEVESDEDSKSDIV